jgi:multidrug efflux pump subunit AcrB
MKIWIKFFIDHPKVVYLILGFVFFAGLTTLGKMHYEYNPEVDLGIVNISTIRAGSGPEDIESSITLPLEEELLKVEGINTLYSNSMENLSMLTLRLDIGLSNKNQVLANIQKAVDRATARMPPDLLEKPFVEEQSTQMTPVIELHISGDIDEDSLRSAARKVSEGLREVEDVAGVKRMGYRRKEIKIFLSPEKIDKLGISINEIKQAILSRNVRDSGGSLTSFSSEKKVISVGQFKQPKDVETVIVRAYEPGNSVAIRDIATVVSDFEDWKVESRTDGKRSIALMVLKQSGADELHTAANIREFAKKMRTQLPPGVELIQVNDISRLTVQMLDVLIGNALLGLILVLGILYFTLNHKLAFWVALGMPFSIILAFLVMYLFDITLNGVSLMAVILMIGIVVDDAVVVGESVQRHRERGLSGPDAALQGTIHVAKPVIFAILTTMIAFSPLLALEGTAGEFMWTLPAGVIIILGASLFESQLLLPSHLAHANLPINRPENNFMDRYSARYESIIFRLIQYKKLSLAASVLIFIGIMIFGSMTIRFHMYPAIDIDNILVKVELPEGSSFTQTRAKVTELESSIKRHTPASDLLNIVTQIGHHDTDFYGATEGRNEAWALISIQLKPLSEREVNTHELIEQLRGNLHGYPGLQSLIIESQTDLPVTGKPIEIEVISNGDERFIISEEIHNYLKKHPHIVEHWTSYKPGKDVIDLKFNYDILASRGLSVREVTNAVRVAMEGLIVDELQTLNERIFYRLQLPPGTESRLTTLEQLSIINSRGEKIFLNSIVDFELRAGEADIKHYQGRRTVTVYGEINRDATSVSQINADLGEFIDSQNYTSRYPDVRIWQSGEIVQQAESGDSFSQAFLISLVGIFVVLVLLFNSFSHPLLIILCLPFGLTGVVLGFGLQGIAMGVVATTGVIGLLGILVNDSLVMIYTLNKNSESNQALLTDKEIAHGASLRFRPIVITSLTTVAGLFPTAYGIAGSNSYITPMVMAMAWGVLFGILVTLLILPCLYALDRDIKYRFTNTFQSKG